MLVLSRAQGAIYTNTIQSYSFNPANRTIAVGDTVVWVNLDPAGHTVTQTRGAPPVASESSFDVVSKVDRQEVDNALNQAAKEVGQRYDFKGVGASVEWSGENVLIKANTAERCLAVLDVLETKLVRRGVSLKSIDFGEKRYWLGISSHTSNPSTSAQ